MNIEPHGDELRAVFPDDGRVSYLSAWTPYSEDDSKRIGNAFVAAQKDFIEGLNEHDEQVVIRIGRRKGAYWELDQRVLDIEYALYLSTAELWKRKHFVAEKGVSIFPKFNNVVSSALYIGGHDENAVPFATYDSLIRRFPSTTELAKYVSARLANAIKEFCHVKGAPEESYERLLNKRMKATVPSTRKAVALAEKTKFEYLLARLKDMLANAEGYSEGNWQNEILAIITLLFPKYLVPLKSIPIKNLEGKQRQIDLGLLDVEGNLDVVEIKRPFDNCVMSASRYRNNFVPLRELSGAIMQVEKYIVYLQRGGIDQDRRIQKKFKDQLPSGVSVKVVNPRGMVILGRSNSLTKEQLDDYEVVRRKYARIADIITYDDLIRRLEILRDNVARLR